MLKTTSKTLLLAATLVLPLSLQAQCGGATKAPSATKVPAKTTIPAHQANSEALTLLATMNMKQSYEGMIKRITQMQIQSNPQLQSIAPTIEAFFTKYMGWEAQRGDIAALYAKNYTADELKELNKFYQTPLGQKTVQIMPQLAAASAQIGQSRMMKHMPEMKAMIEAELKKDKK
jgi:hypothetical protein